MSEHADPNATDQAAAWNGAMGERWLSHHARLDLMLQPLGAALREAVGAVGEGSVLDIGCGTGETTRRLADHLRRPHDVIGVDVSEPLIAAAQAAAPGLRFLAHDAATFVPDEPAALVASRFGTMFFPDPAGAFAHLHSVLAPHGRLAMVVWNAPPENEWVARPLGAAADLVELPPPPPPGGPGPFSLADPAATESLLAGAGFSDVHTTVVDTAVGIGADAVTTADFLLDVLPTGPVLDALTGAERERVVAGVAAALPDEDRVSLGASARVVVAGR